MGNLFTNNELRKKYSENIKVFWDKNKGNIVGTLFLLPFFYSLKIIVLAIANQKSLQDSLVWDYWWFFMSTLLSIIMTKIYVWYTRNVLINLVSFNEYFPILKYIGKSKELEQFNDDEKYTLRTTNENIIELNHKKIFVCDFTSYKKLLSRYKSNADELWCVNQVLPAEWISRPEIYYYSKENLIKGILRITISSLKELKESQLSIIFKNTININDKVNWILRLFRVLYVIYSNLSDEEKKNHYFKIVHDIVKNVFDKVVYLKINKFLCHDSDNIPSLGNQTNEIKEFLSNFKQQIIENSENNKNIINDSNKVFLNYNGENGSFYLSRDEYESVINLFEGTLPSKFDSCSEVGVYIKTEKKDGKKPIISIITIGNVNKYFGVNIEKNSSIYAFMEDVMIALNGMPDNNIKQFLNEK